MGQRWPKIVPSTNENLIYSKVGISNQRRKDGLLSLGIEEKNTKMNPYFTAYPQINPTEIKYLNINESYKITRGNIDKYF